MNIAYSNEYSLLKTMKYEYKCIHPIIEYTKKSFSWNTKFRLHNSFLGNSIVILQEIVVGFITRKNFHDPLSKSINFISFLNVKKK